MNRVKHRRDKVRRIAVAAMLFTVLDCIASSAVARMYQWMNPVTHSVQLSGTPPAWYRDEHGGPRVLVYERGRVIDDTARPVEPNRRVELRASAFGEGQPPTSRSPASQLAPSPATSQAETVTEMRDAPAAPPKSDQLETFKALLEAWDREQAAAATRTITPAAPSPLTPPPRP